MIFFGSDLAHFWLFKRSAVWEICGSFWEDDGGGTGGSIGGIIIGMKGSSESVGAIGILKNGIIGGPGSRGGMNFERVLLKKILKFSGFRKKVTIYNSDLLETSHFSLFQNPKPLLRTVQERFVSQWFALFFRLSAKFFRSCECKITQNPPSAGWFLSLFWSLASCLQNHQNTRLRKKIAMTSRLRDELALHFPLRSLETGRFSAEVVENDQGLWRQCREGLRQRVHMLDRRIDEELGFLSLIGRRVAGEELGNQWDRSDW